ncbi:MAG TPA: response regulator [Propionibacteriaceae bacterium]
MTSDATTEGPTPGVLGTVRRILVVDDDEMLREVAKAALELVGGWQVLTASSGVQAQSRAVEERPDAILLDVMMPGMDGPATVALLRESPSTREIPVIFLTAKAPTEDIATWGGLELAGVIPKPFDPMTLAADMSRLLGWQK